MCKLEDSVTLHPERYPKHNTDKGQVYEGECNTTRCEHLGAVYFNNQTRGMYCQTCAWGINKWSKIDHGADICLRVKVKPTIEEMDRLYSDFWNRKD